ncbi:hypothetical protein SGQ44_00595 [Flavobacterium sp. Fl-77]|uniref:Uncharacterized protein n=1 Tax=Flavobacterium flavipigmentatum TaxID=2893884 RepID=A0AAJ2SCZ2_9FLAO|nr:MULTISPECIES: hypothetical protein [unclassified Flavobacterium]MDX6180631.1 hypothetical protein [Flavobacterium sp. Fl-33]MDX6184231.1 hypothetical protein [Flavobacterium sp. Fl-77]UFH39343.1 hypothetical protein LNP22_03495 [Flavobacterium sp. F-70]
MKNSMTTTVNDFQVISVVIPSLNGSYAKLLFLTGVEYAKLKETSKSNIGQNKKIFSLYMESNVNHDLLQSGMGVLTKKQFDELLKENYNSKMQQGRGGKLLRDAV